MTTSTRRRALAAVLGSLVCLVAWVGFTVTRALNEMCVPPLPPTAAAAAPLPPHDDSRPTAVVLLSQAGTEITDFLAPYAILTTSGAFNVYAVAPSPEPAPMNGRVGIFPHLTLAAFDEAHPRGADLIVLPNVMDPDNPTVIEWVKSQARRGAVTASICEGARVLANTGLLDGRAATTHFAVYDDLKEKYPAAHWRNDVRYVVDGPVVMSAGVSSAVDASLYLVRRFAGEEAAARTAATLGLGGLRPIDVPAPVLSTGEITTAVLNGVLSWPQLQVRVPLTDGIDELAMAAALDSYGRTFAASSASTSPQRQPVLSRHGLLLVPFLPAAETRGGDVVVDATQPQGHDGSPFDPILLDIAARFGGTTAELVADQIQYPATHLRLGTVPSPVLHRSLVFVLLILLGAGVGLAVQGWRASRHRTP